MAGTGLLEFPFAPLSGGSRFSALTLTLGEKPTIVVNPPRKAFSAQKAGVSSLELARSRTSPQWGSVRGCSLKTEE